MKHLKIIDGLRAWLALWVIIAHVMLGAGYTSESTGLRRVLQQGHLAVGVFMIISGFVIFMLLQKREENYRQFITRRFFRLFPAYGVFLIAAVATIDLKLWAVTAGPAYLANQIPFYQSATAEYWQTLPWNLPLHLSMLQGLLPDSLLGPYAQQAYLPPAWSISLEWQFYLVAPLIFLAVTTARSWGRLLLAFVVILLIYAGHHYTWSLSFLPFNVDHFAVGIISCFVYEKIKPWCGEKINRDIMFPTALVLAISLYLFALRQHSFIPLCGWLLFFALLLENSASISSRLHLLFTNPPAQFIGRISYSVYLSHWTVMILMQATIVKFIPPLEQRTHFLVLLVLTLLGTVGVSALSYRFIETPAMRWGKRLARQSHG